MLEVIEICNEENWIEREKYWIDYYRKLVPNLCNRCDGGRGGLTRENLTTEQLENKRILMSNTFSKFSDKEKLSIWKDMKLLSNKDLYIKYPNLTRNIIYQVKNGYCWNNITNLPKNKSIKGRIGKQKRIDFKTRLNITQQDVDFIINSKGIIKQKDLAKKYDFHVNIIKYIQNKHVYYS